MEWEAMVLAETALEADQPLSPSSQFLPMELGRAAALAMASVATVSAALVAEGQGAAHTAMETEA